jgi:hypothetical protein
MLHAITDNYNQRLVDTFALGRSTCTHYITLDSEEIKGNLALLQITFVLFRKSNHLKQIAIPAYTKSVYIHKPHEKDTSKQHLKSAITQAYSPPTVIRHVNNWLEKGYYISIVWRRK